MKEQLPLILGSIGTVGSIGAIALLIYTLRRLRALKEDFRELRSEIKKIKNQATIESGTIYNKTSELKQQIQDIKQDNFKYSREVIELRNKLNHELNRIKYEHKPIGEMSFRSNQFGSESPSWQSKPQEDTKSKLIDDIITNFNQKNSDYFKNNNIFEALDLTRRTKEGERDTGFTPIIELEFSSDNFNCAYLKVEIDGENWLIPNAASINLPRILKNLEQYPGLFDIDSGLGEIILVKPAKIREIGSRLWEIEQPGQISRQ